MEKALLHAGTNQEYFIKGMHCAACEMIIEKKLSELKSIKNVNAVLSKNKIYFQIKKSVMQNELISQINRLILEDGYMLQTGNKKDAENKKDLLKGFYLACMFIIIFILLQKLGIANILNASTISLPVVFFVGIIASLSTCMGIVGGLVLSISSSYLKGKDKIQPLVLFHLSRITSFFLLGGIAGLIGSVITPTPFFFLVISIILFCVMIILGINLIGVYPIFRKLQIRFPKSWTNKIIIKKNNKAINKYAPLLLGAITFFLPCGFTQSMQFNAIASGRFFEGALIMLVFSLGTLPVLSLISFTSFKFSQSKHALLFFKTSGFLVIFFAVFNFLSALVAAGIINPIF